MSGLNWQGAVLPTVIPLVLYLAGKYFDRRKDRSDVGKTDAEADKTKIDANVALTESNLRGALEAATRSDTARELAERARDGCRQSLVKSLDLTDTVLDVVEQFLDRLVEKTANTEDYADVHATLRTVRREVRELRP